MGDAVHGPLPVQNQLMKVIQNLNEQLTRLEQGSKPIGPQPQGERLPKGESRCWKAPEAAYVEPKPPDPSWITPPQNPCTHNFLLNSYSDDYKGADKTKLYTFSGRRNYLDWERNLDEWFYYNNILKKERLAYAIDQLRDVALKWWVQEEDDIRFYKEPPITTWRDLREIMRDKYAKKYTNSQIKELYPRRYPTHSSKKAELKSKTPTQKVPAKAEQQTEKHKQCKSSNSKDLKDQTCYRCHKRGHFAVVCPTKQLLVETSLEKKTDLSMMSDSFIQSDLLVPNSCVMHLSLPMGVVTGIKEHEEEAQGVTFVMGQKMVQDTMQSMLLKEAKPVIRVSHQGKCLTPPLDTSIDVCVLGTGRTNESYKLTEVPVREPDHKLNHEPTNTSCPKKKIILQLVEAIKVSLEFSHFIYKCPNTDIMHLLLAQNVEIISGCREESFKEIPPDNLMLLGESIPRETRNMATKNLKNHPIKNRCNGPDHSRGVIISYLLKEEPPDTPCITKPKLYQGKVLNSQKRMKPDLLYLGAGYQVSRSKLCQGGGYDEAIKPVAEPEVDPTPCSTNHGANQNICALKMPYLSNEEVIHHETNFHGFYTQEGVRTNWNYQKIYPDQEDMNFINRRFLSPSIREYQPLGDDLSPAKRRTEPKPILEVKRSLSAFQKAQDHEKWSRKLEDMINFPKPVKPVLHLPYLEAHWFIQLQTRNWRPGETSNHSGDTFKYPGESDKFLQCTSKHRNRRIFNIVNFPFFRLHSHNGESFTNGSFTNLAIISSTISAFILF